MSSQNPQKKLLRNEGDLGHGHGITDQRIDSGKEEHIIHIFNAE